MPGNMIRVPDPMFFRKRLYCDRKLNTTEKGSQHSYHMVPRFFDFYHPTTTWLINVIRSENERELNRVLMDKETKSLLKFEPDPKAIQCKRTVMGGKKEFIITKAKYFQILDRPEFYNAKESRAPLFNRHAVMYLTPLGLAIYMRKPKAARILVQCVDRDTNKKHIQARQPQFISYMNERFGDLMCMYDHNLAILNETYDIMSYMLRYDNWFPMEPHRVVYRKQFVETHLSFDDYLDYAFYVLFTKHSSLNIPGLVESVLQCPTEHFRFNYMNQPSRATKLMLLRDPERIINNCKTYPRRLLRCAFYADKKLKSTMNLVRAAAMFINRGIFKLVGEPVLPFVAKPSRRKRLEMMPPYKERSRGINIEWPTAYYEFDADCCVALLAGLVSKCYRLVKLPTFSMAVRTTVKVLADSGWLNHFNIISDLEFRDYFMGIDDAEKVRFQPEIFSFIRECARITVIDQRHELSRFFSEERLDQELAAMLDLRDPEVLTRMIMCKDENITKYVTLDVGEELKEVSVVICGKRIRGKGRNDPKNKYYMDRLEFPRESTKTIMTNTANTEDEESSGGGGAGVTSSESDDEVSVGGNFVRHNLGGNRRPPRRLNENGNARGVLGRPNDAKEFDEDMWRQHVTPIIVDAEVFHDSVSVSPIGSATALPAVTETQPGFPQKVKKPISQLPIPMRTIKRPKHPKISVQKSQPRRK